MLDRILRRKRQCRTENAPQLRVPVKLPHRLRTKEIVVIFAPFGEADKSRRAAFPAPSFSLFCWPLRRMQECSGIPRSPFSLSLSLSVYLVSLRAPITKRNAHLPRGRGPIMVSDHSKLLSSAGQKGGRIQLSLSLSLSLSASFSQSTFLVRCSTGRRIFNPTGNLTESTFRLGQRRRWSGGTLPPTTTATATLRDDHRLAFLITVMVHRRSSGNTNRAMEIATLTSGKSLFY